MSFGIPAGITTAMAAAAIAAYVLSWCGLPLTPWPVALLALGTGLGAVRSLGESAGEQPAPLGSWLLVVTAILVLLAWPAWPDLLPRGGASDLTHHLMLVDVIERTRHLVDGAASEAALGEMAHYTPGLHLLVVVAGSLSGVEAYRTAYPLVALSIALKGGFLFLLAHDALDGRRGRLPLALAAVGLVLFAPRAYSLDGFLQAGFYAQVASELFMIAGWWGLARWRRDPKPRWLALVGLVGAAVFLVWPIWIGPLLLAGALVVWSASGVPPKERVRGQAWMVAPVLFIATLHLSEHAAWLRMAGTSGAVPGFAPDWLAWLLIALAIGGIASAVTRTSTRVTLFVAGAIVLQALALWLLAALRGAAIPYMAMKMLYLAVYPAAVLGALGLASILGWSRAAALPAAWTMSIVVIALGVRAAASRPVPQPLVSIDLDRAGRWARANLEPACVDYLVDDAEQAYWLHLAVMGQPRSSTRTADIDGYTTNRAVGRWIEGDALPYAIARRDLLPGEVVRDAETVAAFGDAVVIQRRGVACPLPIANR
jgi:hypothetical protein